MFDGLVIAIAFIAFCVGCIILGGNLFPFDWENVKIGAGLAGFSVITILFSLWSIRD